MPDDTQINLAVAVLGGGFAGVACVQSLARGLQSSADVSKIGLISEENCTVYQPMLPEVVGASISPRHVVNPLRRLCRRARVLRGRVESIDWPARSLTLNAGPFSGNIRIRCEQLVLALGAVVDLSNIPGMPEHAFLMKNVGDAMQLRTTIIGRIEEANLEPRPEIKRRLLTFVVVGGGYSGVETAGHILDLFRSIHRYYPLISQEDLRVCLVHVGEHLLPTLSRKLGEYSARKLTESGLNLMLGRRVKAVTASRVHLDDGSVIESNTVISTVGNAPHPLVQQLSERDGFTMEKGRVRVEPTGQVQGQTRLWAAGDCSAFPLVTGGYCPGTAQFAVRQGKLVGQNIVRQSRQKPLAKFSFKGMGEMASIGHHVAVANVFGVNFSGFLAWWLWRTVYLSKLPSLDRKVRVMLDWTLDLFFPRDINHLSPRFSKPVKEIVLKQGDVLFEKGEPAFSYYVVKSGFIQLERDDEIQETFPAGSFFGDNDLRENEHWNCAAHASEPTQLVSVPFAVFQQFIQGVGALEKILGQPAPKSTSRPPQHSTAQEMAG